MKNKGCCARCGRPVNGEGAFEMFYIDGCLIYKHITCPISDALAALPPITRLLPDYMTVAEAAALLRVSVSTIRLRIRRGTLPAMRLQGGQTVLIRRGDVEGLLSAISAAGDRTTALPAPCPVLPHPIKPQPAPRPSLPCPTPSHRRPLPPASPARFDAPDDGGALAGPLTGHLPDAGPDDAVLDDDALDDRAPVVGVWDLASVPTVLLARRDVDAQGCYPGGMALYRAEEAELDRRSRALPPEPSAR